MTVSLIRYSLGILCSGKSICLNSGTAKLRKGRNCCERNLESTKPVFTGKINAYIISQKVDFVTC